MRRGMYLFLGWFFFALGMIGALLPILPTVPFLILSAACFSNGSPRAFAWLLQTPVYGPMIKKWRDERRIPFSTKILATVLLILTLGSSIVFFIPLPVGKIGAALIGIGVLIFLWRQKS